MLYTFAHIIVSLLAKILFRLKVIGHENIPVEGGVIIASNHLSYLDIPLLGCSMKRKAGFIGKSELFRNPVINYFFRSLGGFPIKRGKVDREAISEALKRLNKGEVIVIYPEGSRGEGNKLREPKPGVGMIASMSGAKVVPAYIDGTDKILPKGSKWIKLSKLTIAFGKPIDFKNYNLDKEGKELYSEISRVIMDHIAELAEPIPLSISPLKGEK